MHAQAVCYGGVPSENFGDVAGAELIELPIDDSWRSEVRARLRAMGRDQYQLADHIGCSQGNISQSISMSGKRKPQKTSIYAYAISLAVGVPLPLQALAVLVSHGAVTAGDPRGAELILEGIGRQLGIRIPTKSGS